MQSATRSNGDTRIWRWVALTSAALLLTGLAIVLGPWGPGAIGPILGLRLGMSPSQAREHLRTDDPGVFTSETTEEDYALTWRPTATDRRHSILEIRLEFHLGQLVAVRAELSSEAPEALGPARQVTDASVLTREADGNAIVLTWLSRDCPTHADEVRRRLAEPP